jgi:uncharacterized membrane protein
MKKGILLKVLRAFFALLILRALGSIVANYSDYFPPDFQSSFLQGREGTFPGTYQSAFYVHIFSGPLVLLNGLLLMTDWVIRYRSLHRFLGWVQIVALLVFMLPSGMVMALQSFGGFWAGLSFMVLSGATGVCAILGVVYASRGKVKQHRRWMVRSYVLICSAVFLRLVSGAAGLVGVTDAERAYVFAAWMSWVLPLMVWEIVERFTKA